MEKLDFNKRYMVGHGTHTYATFKTAKELNEWFNNQNCEGKYFCRLYDTKLHIDIKGSQYLFLDDEKKWKN